MRSESVCWLLGTAGLKVRRIRGGYKAYRALIEPLAGALKRLIVLSGPTGSGKSDILHELERRGEQVLDLEGLARHKGSAFGGLTGPQESCEMFVNRLINKLSSFDPGKRVWCEGESRSIGRVTIPEALWETMRGACSVYIDAPVDRRMERIMAEYGDIDPQALKGAFDRITKRLGLEKTLQAKDAVDRGDIDSLGILRQELSQKHRPDIRRRQKEIALCRIRRYRDARRQGDGRGRTAHAITNGSTE